MGALAAVRASVRAEFTKIITMRSVWIATAVILALHLLIQRANLGSNTAAVTAITPQGTIEIFTGDPEPARGALLDLMVAGSFQMVLFLPVLAALIAGQEFRSRQLDRTLLAVPHRGRLVIAKTIAAAGFLTVVAVLIAMISIFFLYAATRAWDPGLATSADALCGQAGFLALAVLTGLVGLAFTMLGRGTLAGIGATVVLTVLTMTRLLARLSPALDAMLPLSAGRNLLLNPAQNTLSSGPAPALIVLLLWPLVTLTATGIVLYRQDAR
ncbi:hypothetical protein [Actinoplanes sp. NPDC051851]|uniref:hypothetical protein n=1 Tax=Actinoplanes sp. NPDC051851 TaxID=3154753 RepID=UPI003449D86D